ncbi:EB domain-containing protein [Meloidogyne graminicola]|uniref:EB domain-containing protein n=1 Tax=Meloidogyne graminicola TaxID=189291 RepID=A0A8S9ZT91_9BILA|nr:EB domain-containing protein [Meloidogyne graminicola]
MTSSSSFTLFSLIFIFTLIQFCLTTKNLSLRIEPSKRQAFGATCGPLPAGCAAMPVAALPPAPAVSVAPIPTGRLIPQALPGAPCEPGVECTGGSVCSQGICKLIKLNLFKNYLKGLCPPELVQEGTVCVSRTIYGVIPPPPPPIAAAPLPLPPPPIPIAYYPSPLPPPIPSPIAPSPIPIVPTGVIASYPIAAAAAPPPPPPPSPQLSPTNPCIIPPYGRFRAACIRRNGEQIQQNEGGILYNLDDDGGSNSIERDIEWKK